MGLSIIFLAIAILALGINIYIILKFLELVKDVRYMLLTVINIKESLDGKKTDVFDEEMEY